jgi:hypothetical protein
MTFRIPRANGVPIQEISDTVSHKSTHVTETVYRHVNVPLIRGGSTVMEDIFGDDQGGGNANENAKSTSTAPPHK